MFDFEEMGRKQFEKVKIWFKMESKSEIYTPKFVGFVEWWLTKLTPFILMVAGFITTAWLFNYIKTKYGFEYLIIIIAIILMFALNNIHSELTKLTKF